MVPQSTKIPIHQSNFKFIHLIPRKFVHDTATLIAGALFMPCCWSRREDTLWPMFIVFAWGPQRPTSNCSLLSWQSKSDLGAPSKIPILQQYQRAWNRFFHSRGPHSPISLSCVPAAFFTSRLGRRLHVISGGIRFMSID